MNEALSLVLSAVLGSVLGGGALYKIVLSALTNHMRQEFATAKDVDRVGDRVNALETVAMSAKETADHANDRAGLLEQNQHTQWERITEQVIKPLERITERLEKLTERQIRIEAKQDKH